MARPEQEFEPAFAWAALLTCQAFYGFFVWLAASRNPAAPAWGPSAVAAYLAYSALGGACVTAAMAAPEPRQTEAGTYPWRLRAAWQGLRLAAPPAAWARGLLAGLTAAAFAPKGGAPVFGALAAAGAYALPRDSKSWRTMGLGDGALFFGAAGAVLWSTVALLLSKTPADFSQSVTVLCLAVLYEVQQAREIVALRWKALAPALPPPPALDLGRYELTVDRAAPDPALLERRGPDGEVLVESGSFRVDPKKMLEKLRERQLADPRGFILAWLRCAAASGATEIRLEQSSSGLVLTFDGRPFKPAELEQPYAVLLEGEGEDAVRGRHFAYGLLALQRLRPAFVTVQSGKASMAVAAPGAGVPVSAPVDVPGTVVHVGWPWWLGWWRAYEAAKNARLSYGLGAARFYLNGVGVRDFPIGAEWKSVRLGGRGAAWRPVAMGAGLVRLYHLGTFIEEVDAEELSGAEGWVSSESFELDISQSSVRRDAEFKDAMDFLVKRVRGF